MTGGSLHHKYRMTQTQTLLTNRFRPLKTLSRTFSLYIPKTKAKKCTKFESNDETLQIYVYIHIFISVSMWIKQRLVVQMENKLGASRTSGCQCEIWRSQTKQDGVEEVWNRRTTRGFSWLMNRTWRDPARLDTNPKLLCWPVHVTPWRHISGLRRPGFWRRTESARRLHRKS